MQPDYEETIKKGSSGQKPDNGKGAAARANDSDASGGNVASVSGSRGKPEKDRRPLDKGLRGQEKDPQRGLSKGWGGYRQGEAQEGRPREDCLHGRLRKEEVVVGAKSPQLTLAHTTKENRWPGLLNLTLCSLVWNLCSSGKVT